MSLRYVGGVSGDKYAVLTENFLKQKSRANLDRKRYAYWQIYNVMGLVGVIVYTDTTKTTTNVHIHAPGCLNRTTLKLMLHYPFDLGLEKIFGTIGSHNETACRNAEKIGFKLEHTLEDYYATGVDMKIYCLTKSNAQKWIDQAHRQATRILETVT